MDHDSISPSFKLTLESLDFICLVLMTLESLLKICGMPLKQFFHDPFNIIDLGVCLPNIILFIYYLICDDSFFEEITQIGQIIKALKILRIFKFCYF